MATIRSVIRLPGRLSTTAFRSARTAAFTAEATCCSIVRSLPRTCSAAKRQFTVIGGSTESIGRSSNEQQRNIQHTEPGTTATTTPSQPLTSGTSVLIRTFIVDATSQKDETIVRHLSYRFTTQTEFDRFLDRSQSSGLCEADSIQNGEQHVQVVTQLSELQDNVLYVNINAACVTC